MFDSKIFSFCLNCLNEIELFEDLHPPSARRVASARGDLCVLPPFLLSTLKFSFLLAPVWKWEPAAGVGQAGERARRAGEAEEAASPGGAGPGAGHRSQQGPNVQLLTGRDPSSSDPSPDPARDLTHRLLPPEPLPSAGPWSRHPHWLSATAPPFATLGVRDQWISRRDSMRVRGLSF